MKAKKLLFLATEDWFMRSHFMPLVRRARAEGYEVSVAARLSGADLEGARAIEMPFARGGFDAGSLAREALSVRALMKRERPDIVHAIALKPIALLLLAGVPGVGRVLAVTGRGYLGVRGAAWTKFVSDRLAGQVRRAIVDGGALLLVENRADRRWIEAGTPLPDARVLLMPGAGVDVEKFKPEAEPTGPIRIGIASRLVWSKGVDIAVEALRRLRSEGRDIELHIAGRVDRANPEHVPDSELALWAATPGIVMHGRVEDVAAFWTHAHIACFPSRGGEGLPRSLLEAAACGRAIVAADTPGCADFVRAGDAGLLAPCEDPGTLAEALSRLSDDAALRQRSGAAARALVVARYTEAHAADRAAEAWARLS